MAEIEKYDAEVSELIQQYKYLDAKKKLDNAIANAKKALNEIKKIDNFFDGDAPVIKAENKPMFVTNDMLNKYHDAAAYRVGLAYNRLNLYMRAVAIEFSVKEGLAKLLGGSGTTYIIRLYRNPVKYVEDYLTDVNNVLKFFKDGYLDPNAIVGQNCYLKENTSLRPKVFSKAPSNVNLIGIHYYRDGGTWVCDVNNGRMPACVPEDVEVLRNFLNQQLVGKYFFTYDDRIYRNADGKTYYDSYFYVDLEKAVSFRDWAKANFKIDRNAEYKRILNSLKLVDANAANVNLENLEDRINKLIASLEKAKTEIPAPLVTMLPPVYTGYEEVQTMLSFIVNRRADTLKEAINLYEDLKWKNMLANALTSISAQIGTLNQAINRQTNVLIQSSLMMKNYFDSFNDRLDSLTSSIRAIDFSPTIVNEITVIE